MVLAPVAPLWDRKRNARKNIKLHIYSKIWVLRMKIWWPLFEKRGHQNFL